MFNSNKIFYDRIRIRWPFNTGDCLIEVTAWAGMTAYVSLTRQSNSSFSEKKSWMQVVNLFTQVMQDIANGMVFQSLSKMTIKPLSPR